MATAEFDDRGVQNKCDERDGDDLGEEPRTDAAAGTQEVQIRKRQHRIEHGQQQHGGHKGYSH